MIKPFIIDKTLASGARLIRYDNLEDIFFYDERKNNPDGLGFEWCNTSYSDMHSSITRYKRDRRILTESKLKLIAKAQENLSQDKEFLDLVYKAKSAKRAFKLNKFGGNLSMAHYASNNEKVFKKNKEGAKKQTLNMAFQVGTFAGGNYEQSFQRIIKTIMMCQAMNINVSIDMFDSDTSAINSGPSYVICNVCKASEKLNLRNILAASHSMFFHFTLFNGYSGSDSQYHIGTFLSQERIIRDLAPMYDVVGGNLLINENSEDREMVSKILKIGINGNY